MRKPINSLCLKQCCINKSLNGFFFPWVLFFDCLFQLKVFSENLRQEQTKYISCRPLRIWHFQVLWSLRTQDLLLDALHVWAQIMVSSNCVSMHVWANASKCQWLGRQIQGQLRGRLDAWAQVLEASTLYICIDILPTNGQKNFQPQTKVVSLWKAKFKNSLCGFPSFLTCLAECCDTKWGSMH